MAGGDGVCHGGAGVGYGGVAENIAKGMKKDKSRE